MCAGKNFKKQFQVSMFNLEHHTPSDFYLSCWQRNRSSLPLLCLRTVLFLGCLAILLSSLILTGLAINLGFWFIYMTHWGLVMITIASGFAFAVSICAYRKGPIEATFVLPWYVKLFWAFYDIAVVVAFFITIYYYAILVPFVGEDIDFAIDPVLDVFIHGINSVLMLLLLMTSRHPSRLLHFIYPLCFGIIYLAFTGIYYAAGGVDPFGNRFIYPTLDWAEPGLTLILVAISAVALVLVHGLVAGMAAGRNALARRFRKDSDNVAISNQTNIPAAYM